MHFQELAFYEAYRPKVNRSDTAHIRAPYVFVNLELKPNGQSIIKNPASKIHRRQSRGQQQVLPTGRTSVAVVDAERGRDHQGFSLVTWGTASFPCYLGNSVPKADQSLSLSPMQ